MNKPGSMNATWQSLTTLFKGADETRSWTSLVVTVVAVLLTLRVLLHVLLALFVPRLRIRTVSALGLGSFEWHDASGVVITVERFAWSIVGTNTSKKGWFILRLVGVEVRIPKRIVIEPPPPRPPRNTSGSPRREARFEHPRDGPSSRQHPLNLNGSPAGKDSVFDPSYSPPRTPRMDDDHGDDVQQRPARRARQPSLSQLALRLVRHMLALVLAATHLIVRRLTSLLALFAIEIDLAVELEDVARVKCLVDVGGEIARPFVVRRTVDKHRRSSRHDIDREPHIGVWIAISGLKIHEVLPFKSTIPQTPTPLPAVEIQSLLLLSASTPLGPTGGLISLIKCRGKQWNAGRATVRVSLTIERPRRARKDLDTGVHIRVYEGKALLAKVEDLLHERKQFLHRHPRPDRAVVGAAEELPKAQNSAKPKPTPLFFLRSFDADIPLVVVSAHYHTPHHTLAVSPKRQLPQAVAFALTIRNISARLRMSGSTDMVKREHAEWLGKDRILGLGGTIGWGEIEGRVKVDGSAGECNDELVSSRQRSDPMMSCAEDILPNSAKAFSIGRSSVTTTTTWLPPKLFESFAAYTPELVTYTSPRYFNDETVVIEGYIGEVRGHAKYETIDSALRIFMARPRSQYGKYIRTDLSSTSEAKVVRGAPRVVGHIAMAGIELRVQAPTSSSEDNIADDRDHFFREWACPDLFCLSIPNGTFSFGGEYEDRSLRRTEADRRLARRNEKYRSKRPGEPPDREASYKSVELRDKGMLTESKIPIKQHYADAPESTLSDVRDLRSLPMKYTARAHLAAETLNIYIIATDPIRGEGGTGSSECFLDQQSTLPSNTRRLDILAAGPVEITLTQQIKCSVKDDAQLGAIAEFNLNTLVGEHNILVEHVGIDLWRPIVMSCLRDFVSSWASASATKTTRAKATDESGPPEPKLLVRSLPHNQCFYAAIGTFDVRLAGSDPKNDEQACRGIAVHCGPVVFEYLLQPKLRQEGALNYGNRASLELAEDIRQEANALAMSHREQALVKVAVHDWSIDPVVDARETLGHTRKYSMWPGMEQDGHEDASWELRNRAHITDLTKRRKTIMVHRPDKTVKRIAHVPRLALRARIVEVKERTPNGPLDEVIVSVKGRTGTFRLELFSIYLCLVAFSALRSLSPEHNPELSPRPPAVDPDVDVDVGSDEVERAEGESSKPHSAKRPKPLISLRGDVDDLNLFITLPHNVPLYLKLKRPCVQYTKQIGLLVEWDTGLLAGDSPTVLGKWDDLLRLRVTSLAVRPEPGNDGHRPFVISLSSETARMRIPFRYIYSRIIDNVANLIKATKQLVHQHVEGGMNSVLEPEAEAAKKLPRIELNIKMFAIEIQDDPFETRLNIIWRAGYEEQSARIERQLAFQAKLEAIRKAHEESGVPLEDDIDIDGCAQETPMARHDANGPRGPNGHHTVSPKQALHDLLAYNSSHWVKRMRNAVAEQARREEALTRRLYGGKHNSKRPDSVLPVPLLPTSKSVPLARATLHNLQFTISRTSFADEKLPDFLHDVGKGLPRDTQFTLLVPMHVNVQMSEATIRLRDYPLPLLHIPIAPVAPDVAKTQTPKASWIMDMDLVIGEEIGSEESIRRVPVVIVPAHAAKSSTNLYSIVVPRTAMTTKTYAVPTIRVRSPYATRIGWGNSISPAIQDVAKVLDTITKQSPDPSDRIGFWDKIRLQFHWRVSVLFEGEGPVHFHLKGSRDPYSITGFGAGFVKSWHGSVKFLVGHQNPDREFFQILSDRYILGVPNLRDYVDNAATGLAQTNRDNAEYTDNNTTLNGLETGQYKFGADTEFVKVCARLVHGVRWGMGCVVERACTDKTCDKVECKGRTPFHRACRIWDFISHWEVHTKTDQAIKPNGEVEDSFAGFRSDFIHFSISLTSPSTLDLPSCGASPNPDDASSDHEAESFVEDGDKSNSLHFTPHAMAHFARWWKLFDGTMSLPIRQGKLFPSSQAPSKKFGKHCATIKYRFSLAPLFISHTYRQDAPEEWAKGETTALGIKAKIGRFNVDLHQREQESLVTHSDTMVTKQVIHKAFYLAEVDLDDVDLRAISATFSEPEKAQLAPLEEMNEGEQELPPLPLPNISDEDLAWVDRDDYVDISYSFEDEAPRVRMFPFITCPRLTYDRQVDVARWTPEEAEEEQRRHDQEGHKSGAGDHARSQTLESTHDERSEQAYPKSKFGREPSHTCLVGQAKLASLPQTPAVAHTRRELESRIAAITAIIARLKKVREAELSAKRSPTVFNDDSSSTHPHEPAEDEGEELSHITSHFYSQWGDWENRYMFHNPSMHLTNASRQILLKYYHSSQDRKAFVYHLSATAIKFIRDLAAPAEDPKSKKSTVRQKGAKDTNDSTVRGASSSDVSASARRLLDDLLKSHVEEGKTPGSSRPNSWAEGEDQGSRARQHQDDDHGDMELDPDAAALLLPERYTSKRAHFCMFIKPQIALTSDVDDKSTVILTAFRAQFKSFAVNDSEYPDDPINADVLHSTFATLEGLQAFCPQVSTRTKGLTKLTVPLETLIDLRVEPWGFDRIVPRTWASMRYDKFNKLRLGSSKAVHEQETPHLWAPSMSHFRTGTGKSIYTCSNRIALKNDKLSVSANPTHFTAVYNVVTDLLLYSDPAHKRRNSKLEALVFTHDFTHLEGAIGVVSDLQYKVRSLAAMVLQYRIHLDELDGEGRLEMFTYMTEAIRQASELTLLVESISRARSLSGALKPATTHAGLLFEAKAPELTWHMHDNADIPFAKFSVTGAEFAWTSKSDSSVSNRLVIKDLKALNSSPEHLFAEIIAKYHGDRDNNMAKVNVFAAVLWNALPPVGGISIVEQFELHLHPIRLQLEHHVGRRIMDYVFSQRRKSDEDGGDNRDHSEAESDADSISSGSQKQAQRSLKSKLSNNSLRPPSIAVHSNHSVDSLQLRRQNELALNGSVSQLMSSSASSIHTGQRQLRHVSSMDVLSLATSEQVLDAEEMRARARLNRTFVLVDISPTTLCLTYKSEKSDHSRMFDLFDIVYKTPSMQYRSKTWSFLDLITVMRKDTMKSIWSQRSSLLGQYLSRAHRKLPLTEQRSAMSQGLKSKIKMPFRHKITAPSNHGTPVTRGPTSPLGRMRTASPNPQSYNGDYAAGDAEAAAEAVAEAQEVRGRGQQPEAIVAEVERAEATAALVPFPQAQQHHILSDDRFMVEPEPMVPTPGSPGSPSSLSARSSRSSNLDRVRQLTHPMSEGRSSSHHSDSSSSSYPTHRPLRASISGISDQEKAHLLLGSSFD
ncbi:BZ3500_MvSof-1268-A1-R1_Chr3-3g06455 [Microbotryum saponariae]|uniref:BZ3500_MvSof-1268-A1-R1_Chr3-3g06455 protein n=1 Tax=Microbotryum saponariae TaxID=289078 RepID=A0A2X0NAI6_9BASI|nr:BZ3500_MvSof-1268-A1-R1_Chr3-3g06455 [Microbotryum saponariae]SDA04422.1 BZ3501_MvSof-1269-A2-R1_Chr3-2g06142 [Microbotryum saponariae]